MAGESKAVGKDESREFPKGKLEMATVGGTTVGRATFQPGWRWSESVKPAAGTDSCQTHHFGYCISGHMHVVMDDGQELDVGPGDALEIPPGHDAWVVGDDAYVGIDITGAATFARSG